MYSRRRQECRRCTQKCVRHNPMLTLHVWRIQLDTIAEDVLPAPTPEESARAARFATPDLRRRYLRSHGALRAILRGVLGADPNIAIAGNGKPWLPDAPHWNFNLSHSQDLALVAVARGVEVGVDVEYVRPNRDAAAIVERFFPPSAAAEFFAVPEGDREREFFRLWTRLEAMWKALGVGLQGAGQEFDGPWTVEELRLGEGISAAVAARAEDVSVAIKNFGEDE
ncbi:MAG TPA: 4'-phosphopantetheinyl transferase superfamily protein [Verrucomicrobiae bacterium]|nr:4'-phosphopantetheinyl transferase superfamily protein [Verrucomicrobiae bacterium]